jgi:hypothetical protein
VHHFRRIQVRPQHPVNGRLEGSSLEALGSSFLPLHRHTAHEHVVPGLAAALQAGALTADAVALEARKTADADVPAGPGTASRSC